MNEEHSPSQPAHHSPAAQKQTDKDKKTGFYRSAEGEWIPDGWTSARIGDVGIIITGKTPSKANPHHWGNKVDFITPTDYTDFRTLNKVARKLSADGEEAFLRQITDSGSIAVSCIGSDMGKVILTKEKSLTNQQINTLTVAEKHHNLFWYYRIVQAYPVLRSIAEGGGSTMPIVNKGQFENIQLASPPLPEQKAIAAVLGSLDDKIELLREQNETLEALAQTLFKRWFIDFNFPDQNGKPYKDSGGKMIASELGEIPEGWKVGGISSFIERRSISYRCTKVDLEDYGETQIFDQGNSGIYGFTNRKPDFDASIENPVILFTNHTCNYWLVSFPFCAIQNVIPFRGKADYPIYWLYFATKDKVKFIEYKGHWPDFEAAKFIIPIKRLRLVFDNSASRLCQKIFKNETEIQTLTQLRDALLPKLMKGEIRIPVES